MPPEAGKTDERLITKENFETVNYYIFQYASATIALINQAKSLIGDTLTAIVKDQSGKSTSGLISVQKIQQMAQASETLEIAGSFLQTYNKFRTQIDGIEGKHVHDAIKIIFSPETGNVVEVLKQIKTNIVTLNSKTPSDVTTTDDLFKRIFVGDNADKNIKDGATAAKTLVESSNELLEQIEGVKDLLTTLKDVLGNISGTPSSEAAPSESP